LEGFFQMVYRIVAEIPSGRVATYGQIAAFLGNPKSARVVGWAMQAAPRDLNLPCHRVVNRNGGLAPNCHFGGPEIQRAHLEEEGIVFTPDGRVDLEKHLWKVKLS
jgi:methylated-DNA-protein-cysteine methyltransferase related protein